MVHEAGVEPAQPEAAGLQSAGLTIAQLVHMWYPMKDSNLRRSVCRTDALAAELIGYNVEPRVRLELTPYWFVASGTSIVLPGLKVVPATGFEPATFWITTSCPSTGPHPASITLPSLAELLPRALRGFARARARHTWSLPSDLNRHLDPYQGPRPALDEPGNTWSRHRESNPGQLVKSQLFYH